MNVWNSKKVDKKVRLCSIRVGGGGGVTEACRRSSRAIVIGLRDAIAGSPTEHALSLHLSEQQHYTPYDSTQRRLMMQVAEVLSDLTSLRACVRLPVYGLAELYADTTIGPTGSPRTRISPSVRLLRRRHHFSRLEGDREDPRS